jgi:4-amino-4-deoxychorismate lyase
LIIVNGQIQNHISASDRALHYGDGCFTTLGFTQGKVHAWPLHLARLQNNCQRLGIDFAKWQALENDLKQMLIQVSAEQSKGVLKIIITRGQGGRGYSPSGAQNPTYIISTHEFPTHYTQWQNHGIDLTISTVKLGKQPLLAGIKHLNRLEQVLVKQELEKTKFNDAIVCSSDNEIIESSAGNIFWLQDGQWFTPYLDECGVEGVMRNQICDILHSRSQPVKQIKQILDTDFYVQELFICNSLMEIVPVRSLQLSDTRQPLHFSTVQVKILQTHVKEVLLNE